MEILVLLGLPLKLVSAFKQILFNSRYRNLVILPYLIGIVGFVISIIFFGYFWDWVYDVLPNFPRSWIPLWLISFFNFLLGLLANFMVLLLITFFSSIISILCTLIFGSLFLEVLLERLLLDHGLKNSAPTEINFSLWLKSISRSFKNQLIKSMILVSASIALLISAWVPPLALIVLVLSALLLGFEIIDEPLSMLQPNLRDRLKIIKSHLPTLVAVGILFSLLSLIPFGAILFLPAIYIVSVDRLCTWPELAPPLRSGSTTN